MKRFLLKVSRNMQETAQKTASNILSVGIAVLFIIACFSVEAQAQNQTITDFSNLNHWQRNRLLGSDSISWLGGNRYLLTPADSGQCVAMWYKGTTNGIGRTLDLASDFAISFSITFGDGASPSQVGIADGVTFIVTNALLTPKLIGQGTWYIGYGYDTYNRPPTGYSLWNSFCVEFDTEWGHQNGPGAFDEGGPLTNSGAHCGILQYGLMTTTTDSSTGINTYAPIQDGFETVRNKEICVLITWTRTNGTVDGSDGYDLKVFTQELGNNSNYLQLIERTKIHFNTLSAAVPGLAKDSEGRALTTFGFSSSTCAIPNSHEIDIHSLSMGDSIMSNHPTTINPFGTFKYKNTIHNTVYETDFGSTYERHISGFCGETIIDTVVNYSDTIVFERLCYEWNSGFITIELDKNDINHIWAVGGVDGNYNTISTEKDLKWIPPIRDSIIIRLISFNLETNTLDTTYFNFRIFNPHYLDNYFSDSTNLQGLEYNGNSFLILNLDSNEEQNIILPELYAGCEYSTGFDKELFSDVPKIIDGSLHFKLLDTCDIITFIDIYSLCESGECGSGLLLRVAAPGCDSNDIGCEDIEISTVGKETIGKFEQLIYNQQVTVKTTDGKKITDIKYTDLTPFPNYTSEWTQDMPEGGSDLAIKDFSLPCRNDTIYKIYEVCVTLDDGSECCETISFDYYCKSGFGTITINPNPPLEAKTCTANYKIDSIVAPLLPKRITIDFYDNNLNHIFNIYDAYVSAEQLEGSVPFNVSELVSGIYWVVFEMGEEVISVPFIKQ